MSYYVYEDPTRDKVGRADTPDVRLELTGHELVDAVTIYHPEECIDPEALEIHLETTHAGTMAVLYTLDENGYPRLVMIMDRDCDLKPVTDSLGRPLPGVFSVMGPHQG